VHRARCMLLEVDDARSECLGDGFSTKRDPDEKSPSLPCAIGNIEVNCRDRCDNDERDAVTRG
jgi:hypothetical protein